MTKKVMLQTGILVACSVACLTVNVYFYPSKEVNRAAQEIVEDIRSMEAPEGDKKDSPAPDGTGGWFKDLWNPLRVARAAETDISVSNPAIAAIKARLKARAKALMPFFDAGAIGEGKDGFVAIRDMNAVPMQERAKLNPLIKAENEDRKALYREVAKALEVKESDLEKVQHSFAKEWQRSAKPGWWIEDPPGTWKQR